MEYKMTQNKTINEQIEELKKGCGKTALQVGWNRRYCEKGFLCEVCQAKLSTLQESQKMFLDEIDDRIKLIEEVKKDSDEIEKRICDSKLMELIKLKSKIGGEDD